MENEDSEAYLIHQSLPISNASVRERDQSERTGYRVRCLKCGQEGITTETVICPNPTCRINLAAILRDVLQNGHTLHNGRYRIEYPLGKGGFGVTYRAQLTTTNGLVAVKEFFPDRIAPRDPATGALSVSLSDMPTYQRGLDIFRREAQILETVDHRNIVRIRDFFDENNTSYLVMEYLNGPSVKAELRAGRLTEGMVRAIMDAVVSALAAVHEKEIYHLDIKPGNIILEPERGAVLIDFGAARRGTAVNEFSSLPQTQAYAPLELSRPQRGGANVYGPETDIFQLGVTLYELLTGKLPPPADVRADGYTWDPDGTREPWHTLVQQATQVDRNLRPKDVRTWWSQMGSVDLDTDITRLPDAYVAPRPRTGDSASNPSHPSGGSSADKGFPATPRDSTSGQVSQDSGIGDSFSVYPTPTTRKKLPVAVWAVMGIGLVAVVSLVTVASGGNRQSSGKAAPPTPGSVQGTVPVATPTVEPTLTPVPTPTAEEIATATSELKTALEGMTAEKPDWPTLISQAQEAIQQGADVKTKNSQGMTALHLAGRNSPELATLCVKRGANVNASEVNGLTPLHMAALGAAAPVAEILLAAGANPNVKDSRGSRTPLQWAEWAKNEVILRKEANPARFDAVIQVLKTTH